MKRSITLTFAIIMIGWTGTLFAQSTRVRFLIDTSITLMKANAANAKLVNWDDIRAAAINKAAGIEDPYLLGPVMRYLFESVNDFHGAFFYKDSIFKWTKKEIVTSDSIMNEWKKGVDNITRIVDGNIGYLRVPSMPIINSEDFNLKAQKLNDSLCSLLSRNVKGLILDLRLDGGGAMHPMILGVAQLLPQGNLGSFRTNKKEEWILKGSSFYIDSTRMSTINPACNNNAQKLPVVMLTSPVTGSAAECFIIAFRGRKNTVLLGSETAGYITVNNGFPIDDTAFINLSVGYNADRFGKVYKDAINPDIPFTGTDKFNDILNDEKVIAAAKWLKKHK